MYTEFQDKKLKCQQPTCLEEFIWTAGEQAFMERLKENGKLDSVKDGVVTPGSVRTPKNCPACREKRRAHMEAKRKAQNS